MATESITIIIIICVCISVKDPFITTHVISIVGCEISSVNGVADVKGNNVTITFSTVPVSVIRFRCKLDQMRYQPCE